MNERHDDQWLDNLLSQSTTPLEGDFTQQVMGRIQRSKQKRRLILGGAWATAAIATLLAVPWQHLIAAYQRYVLGLSLPTALTSELSASYQLTDIAHWALQSNVAPLLLIGALSLVCLLQWFLQEN